MSEKLNIGFIGAGKMASALAGGFVRKEQIGPDQLMASDPYAASRDDFASFTGGKTTEHNHEVTSFADIVFLAVKTRSLCRGPAIHPRLLAGIPMPDFNRCGCFHRATGLYLPAGGRVIRVMPNTPAMVGSSASALCLGEFATDEDRQRSLALMSTVGTADVVTEKMMDAVTGLSGSGPAYVYQFIEALSDGAVAAGLSRDLATKLAAQTVLGGARMVQETGLHPGILKDMVASPEAPPSKASTRWRKALCALR